LIGFFETNFPDSIPLIGKQKLIEDYFCIKPAALISIKVLFKSLGGALKAYNGSNFTPRLSIIFDRPEKL
jgi:hypothetical protein